MWPATAREGVIELMPTCDGQVYGFKYVNGHPTNTRDGRQTVTAFGVLADVATGYPLLLSEMTLLTALRTAAISAVAAKHLAPEGARIMAIIGNGAQCEFQALAFRAVCGIDTVRLYDIEPAATAKSARNLAGSGLTVVICRSAEESMEGAQIITTCTADKQYATILTDNMIGSGVHINAIGGDCPGKTELHRDILMRSDIFVEYPTETRIEGEIQQLDPDHPVTELWRVIAGEAPGRAMRRRSRCLTASASPPRISRPCATCATGSTGQNSTRISTCLPTPTTRAISSACCCARPERPVRALRQRARDRERECPARGGARQRVAVPPRLRIVRSPTPNTERPMTNLDPPVTYRPPTLPEALISLFSLVIGIGVSIYFFGLAPQIPMLFGVGVASLVAMRCGHDWQSVQDGMIAGITNALTSIIILMIVGVLIGVWILAGVVPTLVYYGLQVLSPAYFLAAATVICAIASLATGTSWGTTGTIGVALMGVGAGLGLPLPMVAGAVLSGAYFGDKMSPLSDTTNLAPAMVGTDLYTHIRHMMPTTGVSITISLALYLWIGMGYAGPRASSTGSPAFSRRCAPIS